MFGSKSMLRKASVGENLQNSLVFTFGFMELAFWFWVSCSGLQVTERRIDRLLDLYKSARGQARAGEEEDRGAQGREGPALKNLSPYLGKLMKAIQCKGPLPLHFVLIFRFYDNGNDFQVPCPPQTQRECSY